MGDQWLRDYEKARKNAQQLMREVDQGPKPEARHAALLRGNMANLKQETSNLEKTLMAISQNTQAYAVTKKEVARRGDLVAELNDQVERLQDAIRNGARRRLEASGPSESSWRSQEFHDSGGDAVSAAAQEQLTQDDTLDFLHGTVQNLKGIGGNISKEIDLHNTLLGDLEDQTDVATLLTRKHRATLERLSQQSPTCCLWVYIAVMSLILVVLLLFF